MIRPYGPSNYQGMPEETRSHIYKRESAPGKNDGLKHLAIWTASDLFREQTRSALEHGEFSPDALWEVSRYISDHANTHREEVAKELDEYLVKHQSLIRSGMQRFYKIPRNEIIKYGQHPRLLAVGPASYSHDQHFDDYLSSQRPPTEKLNSTNYGYIISTIGWMLYAAAMYEDSQARETENNQNFGDDESEDPPPSPKTGGASLRFERES
ncbi:MAG TPA: hypothetical protein VJB82_03670 [Candidatus Peribacterales bacterium]|nr:hypothetical protein [Candidatus Peribacterales bacterium]